MKIDPNGGVSRRLLLQSALLLAAAGNARTLLAQSEPVPGPPPSFSKSPKSAYAEKHVERAGHQIYVRDYPGRGPAYVMVHGFPDNCRIYEDIASRLSADGHRVVTFDFLGFGMSDKPEGFAYNFAQQMADLNAVVHDLKLGSVIPVGHDAGGPAAVNFALDHPDRVTSLVLLNCYYANSPVLAFPDFIELCCNPKTKLLAHAMMNDPKQAGYLFNFQQGLLLQNMTPALRQRFEEELQPIIAQNFTQQPSAMPAFLAMTGDAYANLAANDLRIKDMGNFKKPVKLIWGVWDKYLSKPVALDIASHFPHATFVGLEAEHWPQFDVPDQVVTHILAAT